MRADLRNERGNMIKTLNDDYIIIARTIRVLDEVTFLAKEVCSDKLITCSTIKGLIDLGVKSDGSIVKKFPRTSLSEVPRVGTQVAIFGLTNYWVTGDIWSKVSWAANAKYKFRAFAHNRKLTHGNKTTELTEELLLTGERGSTLIELIASSTRGTPSDTFAKEYSYAIQKDGGTMSYQTRWEMFVCNSFWVSCSDPRPIGKVQFES